MLKKIAPFLLLAAVGFLAVFLVMSAANAATGTIGVTFTRATQYTDGSPLPLSAITGHAIDCVLTANGTDGSCSPVTVIPGNAQAGSFSIAYPWQGGRACIRLRTITVSGSSVPSNEACVTLPPDVAPAPNAPTNLTITITITVSITP